MIKDLFKIEDLHVRLRLSTVSVQPDAVRKKIELIETGYRELTGESLSVSERTPTDYQALTSMIPDFPESVSYTYCAASSWALLDFAKQSPACRHGLLSANTLGRLDRFAIEFTTPLSRNLTIALRGFVLGATGLCEAKPSLQTWRRLRRRLGATGFEPVTSCL